FAFQGKTAVLVPVRDPEAIANALLKLIGDEKLRNELEESAYRQISKFDWDESALKLVSILESALKMEEKNRTN
ncbi:MAG: hypothetical protein IIB46_03090, partial [Nitrospinae bacterium]|nr:hypothetical protein [Nitrospinota bacterium]